MKPGAEIASIFKSSVEKVDNKLDLPDHQKGKLDQISRLLAELSEDNDDLVLKVYKKFQQNVSKSDLIQQKLTTTSTIGPPQGPRKSESEKLLLKRWADQYFA